LLVAAAIVAAVLVVQVGGAEAKVIYACVQKHGARTHRAKAAMRLVRGSAHCLPGERRL